MNFINFGGSDPTSNSVVNINEYSSYIDNVKSAINNIGDGSSSISLPSTEDLPIKVPENLDGITDMAKGESSLVDTIKAQLEKFQEFIKNLI
jgi:hypothetical protein